jgi:hypothetical protein
MPTTDTFTRRWDFPATVYDIQNNVGTTTSTSYTATLSGSGAATCAVVFIAPSSGRVEIANTMQLWTTVSGNAYCTVEVRTGDKIGSGTVVLSASDNNALVATTTNPFRGGVITVVTGLTPGAAYNVRQVFRTSTSSGGNEGTYYRKHLKVEPLPRAV